jgi:hypothetical protein
VTCGRSLRIGGNFSDTTRYVGHTLCSELCLQLRQECGFEERELLQPDGISDDQVKFFEANLGRPRVGSHGFADDLMPATLQAEFNEPRFKSKPLGEA